MGDLGDLKLLWKLRALRNKARKEWKMAMADGKPMSASWTIIGSGLRALGAVVLVLVAVFMKEKSVGDLIAEITTNLPAILALIAAISGQFIHDVGKRKIQGEIAATNKAIAQGVNGGTNA